MPDKKGCPQSTIDRIFIAVDTVDPSLSGSQAKMLMRY